MTEITATKKTLINFLNLLLLSLIYLYLLTFGWADGGGGHWLVRMEWRPARWSVCLPLLIFLAP